MEKRIANIVKQESRLDQITHLFEKTTRLLDEWETLKEEYFSLLGYYESPQWKEDYEDSNKGDWPSVKCGVLSQDSVYNLISEQKSLSLQMIRVALEYMEYHRPD